MRVTGTKGYVKMDYLSQDIELYGNLKNMGFNNLDDLIMKYSNTVVGKPFVPKNEPLKIELEHFITSIAKDQPPAPNGEDGLQALTICEAVLQSAQHQTPVNPLHTERISNAVDI